MHISDRLKAAVQRGSLQSWRIVDVDEEGVEGHQGCFRNTQKIYLTFPNGEDLSIGTFCSGCAENTSFV
jgi:hypothetical protein